MDFDFLDRTMLEVSRDAIRRFKDAVEGSKPSDHELDALGERIRHYTHTITLPEDFRISAVDGSGEFPILQRDDIFVHFATAAGVTYETRTLRQSKIAEVSGLPRTSKNFILLRDQSKALADGYRNYLEVQLGLLLKDLVEGSDYCEVYSQYGRSIKKGQVTWANFPFSQASQIATHAYLLRSVAELAMAIQLVEQKPRYLVMDTSLVYFLLGDSLYLPELLKRYLVNRANMYGTGVVALCKSHNIPNGDLIGRYARERHGLKDHWYLRLPSEALGEQTPSFLKGKEIPPKLSVSYLFKFEATSFPMRIDVDAEWWKQHISGDETRERHVFEDLDFTCHEVRSYGYPYPVHVAHRVASLTRQERKAIRDLLLQQAQQEGLVRGAIVQDPEAVHMAGI